MNASLIATHFRSMFTSYLSTQIPQVSFLGLVNEKEMAMTFHNSTCCLLQTINAEETGLNFSFKNQTQSALQNRRSNTNFSFSRGRVKPRQTGSKLPRRALPFKKNPVGFQMNYKCCPKLSLFSTVIAQYSTFPVAYRTKPSLHYNTFHKNIPAIRI